EAGRRLVTRYGIKFNTRWRDQVVKRAREAGLYDYTACIFPRLAPVLDNKGEIVDIEISYPEDFTVQMLEYSQYFQVE
ncbi:MAG: peptidase M49, partial [Fidelibacterota bacterium]